VIRDQSKTPKQRSKSRKSSKVKVLKRKHTKSRLKTQERSEETKMPEIEVEEKEEVIIKTKKY